MFHLVFFKLIMLNCLFGNLYHFQGNSDYVPGGKLTPTVMSVLSINPALIIPKCR